MKYLLAASLALSSFLLRAQEGSKLPAAEWVDSVFRTLTPDQKIAQLMVVRLSSIDSRTGQVSFYGKEVEDAVRRFNVGGICLFQGGPLTQAGYINYFQRISKTPLLISMDAENGLGMRLDSVTPLPRQMMLGAVQDPDLIYRYGRVVGEQCRRLGVQLNYAPVVDINNNPGNPVINDRSFGEDKYRVGQLGLEYMKGLQDAGVMACAKHFPGHGNVTVDSHLDLPVVSGSRKELDTVELYPFRQLIANGLGAIMVGHLEVPALDSKPNEPSSLSPDIVNKLLRKKLKFRGLCLTDALEMHAVTKYYPGGSASVQALIAGNDMLCLPEDIETSIRQIHNALDQRTLKWKTIDARVKKVLYAKYQSGLSDWHPVQTSHLTEDLNVQSGNLRRQVAQDAITLLRSDARAFPVSNPLKKRIAYIGLGLSADNAFARRMRTDFGAHVYYFDYGLDSSKAEALLQLIRGRYDLVVVGVHRMARFPANNFGISTAAISLWMRLQPEHLTLTLLFGNAYAAGNFCDAQNLLVCYEDDEVTQATAADLLGGKFQARGKLPVTVCAAFHAGDGLVAVRQALPQVHPSSLGLDSKKLLALDSISEEAIARQALPGCVVLVARNGSIAYEKAFGHLTYDKTEAAYRETIYDLASVTKICATTMAVMKLYEEKRLDLQKTLGDYLPWVRGSNKAGLRIWDVLLHQAGLKAFIPFYLETIDKTKEGIPLPGFYSLRPDSLYSVRVAENMYMRHDWQDTLYARILQSDLGPRGKYVYSDNDFIFMGKIVEAITGQTLDQYVQQTFYDPLGLQTTGFKPRERFPLERIAPTEQETTFRRQLLRGDVHDPGAAMFGGVSGHAGLFSDAYDLAVLEQMLLNGGTLNGQRYLNPETLDYFTAYHSDSSRRGLGFDKPEKDNGSRPEPYPCASASPATFGHTGFTGTCVWVDPKYQLIFIFLSNRVNPSSENLKISSLSVRGNLMEAIYKAMGVEGVPAVPVSGP
jgi:beta-N-acetylhexosaminidase